MIRIFLRRWKQARAYQESGSSEGSTPFHVPGLIGIWIDPSICSGDPAVNEQYQEDQATERGPPDP
jgi:hypothetical protein